MSRIVLDGWERERLAGLVDLERAQAVKRLAEAVPGSAAHEGRAGLEVEAGRLRVLLDKLQRAGER